MNFFIILKGFKMKKSILIGSMITLALALTACGESQADKEKKERDASAKSTKPMSMSEIEAHMNAANAAKPKAPTSPAPEIKLGEPVVPETKK